MSIKVLKTQNLDQELLFLLTDQALISHLSYTPFKHFADISGFWQDLHVWDSSQVHVCVDI